MGVNSMIIKYHEKKEKWWTRYKNPYSIMFHIAGIAAIIWFLVRVLPKPDRINYPCQQVSLTTAISYFAFWGVLVQGLLIWIRKVHSSVLQKTVIDASHSFFFQVPIIFFSKGLQAIFAHLFSQIWSVQQI